jgi:NAD+ synthase
MRELKNSIVSWIKEYATKNKIECLVVGVSGGIDSAVVSTLCSLTGLKTKALNLPISSKKQNTDLSNLQCAWLSKNFNNVDKTCLNLTDAFEKFESTMTTYNFSNELASANSKSRMRMMTLYHVAACSGGIVVGTGNKVEDFGVGFYTKYGDGGVDISPIADLTKTQVRNLARFLDVPEQIIAAPPTDGLWEDSRTDEEQIGATYEELEWAMDYIDLYINTQTPPAPTERQREVLEIYNQFHTANSHKMRPIPVFNASNFKELK